MTRPSAFNFRKACFNMLEGLGAVHSTNGVLILDTIAGPLNCSVQDDWLACNFDEVGKAVKMITNGEVNRFSGKWNWMFTKPGMDELLRLRANLAQVINMKDNELSRAYLEELVKLEPRQPINTRLTYMYRDGDNYKTSRDVVFEGGFRDSKYLNTLLLAFDTSEDNPSIIPGQIGLGDLQDGFSGCESRWDPERDHPWHEVVGLTPIPVGQEGGTLDSRTIWEFSDELVRQVVDQGWNTAYLPPFYPEMAKRHEIYVQSQLAEVE